MALNTWAVSVLRSSVGLLSSRIRMNYTKWTERP